MIACDSTTVNLFKLAAAALDATPDRRVIVTDRENFPTDRYVLEGLARSRGLEMRWVETAGEAIDEDVALASFSHVDYRSGAITDVAAVTEMVHRHGGRVLWDMSHSAGAVPVALDAWSVDLAVGCGYKYLNGGPGTPRVALCAPGTSGPVDLPGVGLVRETTRRSR